MTRNRRAPASPPPSTTPASDTGDRERLWAHVTRDVRPLRRRNPLARPPQAETAEAGIADKVEPNAPPPAARRRKAGLPQGSGAAPGEERKQSLPPLRPGEMIGIDAGTGRRLRRGRLPIEARLDLHGMTQLQAHEALRIFLQAAVAVGRRCVLVITGKGDRLGEGGILRRRLPEWLNDPALRPHLVSITEAAPKDGGSGAFYIYLKRPRPSR